MNRREIGEVEAARRRTLEAMRLARKELKLMSSQAERTSKTVTDFEHACLMSTCDEGCPVCAGEFCETCSITGARCECDVIDRHRDPKGNWYVHRVDY